MTPGVIIAAIIITGMVICTWLIARGIKHARPFEGVGRIDVRIEGNKGVDIWVKGGAE